MSLNNYKEVTRQVCKFKGWDECDVNTIWMLFSEEIGELAGAIRQCKGLYKKRSKRDPHVHLQNEFGDVFSYLFQLAYMMNIDLDQMWHWNQHKLIYKHYPNE